MAIPLWMKDTTNQWIIATGVAIIGIVIGVIMYLSSDPSGGQLQNIEGNNNQGIQVVNSPGTTINNIDSKKLAREIARNMKDTSELDQKEDEILKLKETIERLLKGATKSEYKKASLLALAENKTDAVLKLLEKSAELNESKAVQDWIDLGNIVYYSNTQKALDAYQNAVKLDQNNPYAWNRLGHIPRRLGRLREAEKAYLKFPLLHVAASLPRNLELAVS